MTALQVLAVASEAVPYVKTGGLADVVGALPAALAPHGVAVTTLLPGYPAVMAAAKGATRRRWPELFGGPAKLVEAEGSSGAKLLVLDAPHLFDRPGSPYLAPGGGEWPDNGVRFAALGRAAADAAAGFDALHAHDWQAGLAPAYLRFAPARVPSLFTVHNLAFQGQFPASLFPLLGLPQAAFATAGLEYFGMVGFLKAGLWFADRLSTVSPTYAAEIRSPAGGMGLDGLLRGRADALSGILNGLDTEAWDPARDTALAARFDPRDLGPRARNKAAVQAALGLAVDPAAMLFGFVGRLTWQKGVDLLLDALPAILGAGAQLAILGSGDAELEARVRGAAGALAGRVGVLVGFDDALARRLYGGADSIILPSRFEPCGLAQLCALRYGAVPIVAHVGGLADSVVDANEMAVASGAGTGLQVAPESAEMLMAAIQRAVGLWRDRAAWQRLQANAMASDVSWSRSAARYAAIFRELARRDG